MKGGEKLKRVEDGGGKGHGRDWRGGVAVAVGNGAGRGPRNPGKP